MKKRIYSTSIIALLFSCSILLTSCSAITAQNITNNGSAQGINGNQGMNGNQRMNGNQDTNGMFRNAMMNASLMGKIISVDGNSIKIEEVEQIENNLSPKSNTDNQGMKDNQNNSTQSKESFSNNSSEIKSTGVEKTLTVDDGVTISEGFDGMQRQNNKSNSSIKLSDLKKDEIIAIWYKENTETVERISVIQS